jgi:translocating chain-associated membrane protein 1
MFIAVHHNVTSEQDSAINEPPEIIRYTYGWKDVCAVFFYFLICIVMHAIIQEYVLDVSLVRICFEEMVLNDLPLL